MKIVIMVWSSYHVHHNNSNEFLFCFQSSNLFYLCYFYGDSKRCIVSFAYDCIMLFLCFDMVIMIFEYNENECRCPCIFVTATLGRYLSLSFSEKSLESSYEIYDHIWCEVLIYDHVAPNTLIPPWILFSLLWKGTCYEVVPTFYFFLNLTCRLFVALRLPSRLH